MKTSSSGKAQPLYLLQGTSACLQRSSCSKYHNFPLSLFWNHHPRPSAQPLARHKCILSKIYLALLFITCWHSFPIFFATFSILFESSIWSHHPLAKPSPAQYIFHISLLYIVLYYILHYFSNMRSSQGRGNMFCTALYSFQTLIIKPSFSVVA